MRGRLLLALTLLLSACATDINWNRIPYARVYIPFTTQGDWDAWGVGGALNSRPFIKADRKPAGYAYPDFSFTGFGGVLLVCASDNGYYAFDLSCPVEVKPTVQIEVDKETNYARCPLCDSTYDVFGLDGGAVGAPHSGIAAEENYGLRRYAVLSGADGRYRLISN